MDKKRKPSQATFISGRVQSLIDVFNKKNVTLNDLNFHNQNLTKENNEIKMELLNIRTNCHDKLLSLQNLLHNEPNTNDQIINMIDEIIENTNSNQAISNDQDVFIKMVESKSKFQCENELPCLRDKNEILEKIIESKINYMNDLQKFTSEQLEKHEAIVESLKNEIKIQNQTNDKIRLELEDCRSKCQTLEIQSNESKHQIAGLTDKQQTDLDKLKTFDLHDERHQNEMDSMRMTVINLEQSVQREKHEYEQMKQLLMKQQESEQKTRQSTMQENEFQEFLQKIRNENDELSRKCQQLSIEIERLHQEDSREKVADAGMIATLQSRLQKAESYAHELETKLSELNVKHQKSEQESIEIRTKYQQQTLEFESLRKELATMQEKSSKQHDAKAKNRLSNMDKLL